MRVQESSATSRMLAGMLLLIASPILVLTGLVVFLGLGWPVVFVQERAGRHGKPFTLVKFRTMRPCSVPGEADSARLTRLGAFLRASSLDELPGLWNVFRGDMAFVGPRPLLLEYLPLYSPRQSRRHDVLPGITGWAQVNGRNSVSWAEKLEMDVWYVENRSLALDLRILWLTVFKVLRRDGISAEGQATMERFKGADDE